MTVRRGRPPKGTVQLNVALSESDRRYVDLMCRVMGVTCAEFFAMVLESTRSETIHPVDQPIPEGV